jgi:hypothetical protein
MNQDFSYRLVKWKSPILKINSYITIGNSSGWKSSNLHHIHILNWLDILLLDDLDSLDSLGFICPMLCKEFY